jgi:aspartate aminotransferase-like enzyme
MRKRMRRRIGDALPRLSAILVVPAEASGVVSLCAKLFTVGPVEVREDTMKAMCKPMITHRSEDYKILHRSVVEMLHEAFETDLQPLLCGSSATGLMEACVRSGVQSRMLGMSNGSFGDRWQGIGSENGKEVLKVNGAWGKALHGSDAVGAIDGSIEAVTVVHNESSTGVMNPVHEIAETIRKKADPLLLVDVVTSAGSVDLRLKELDPDAVVFGTQKAMACPPGLAVMFASDRLLKKAETVRNRGYYFDLSEMKKFADRDLTLTTPPISIIYGLEHQLEKMLREGMRTRYERTHEMAELVRSWALKRFGLYAEEGYRSETIIVIQFDQFDFARFNKGLKARGYEISSGYGKCKEITFRIGTMGDLTVPDIKGLLNVMDEVLEEMQ